MQVEHEVMEVLRCRYHMPMYREHPDHGTPAGMSPTVNSRSVSYLMIFNDTAEIVSGSGLAEVMYDMTNHEKKSKQACIIDYNIIHVIYNRSIRVCFV